MFRSIVFDLDDTLLDTWGQLVQPAAREACQAMLDAGLAAEDLAAAVAVRARLFQKNPRGEVYGALVAHFGVKEGGCPIQVAKAGHRAYFHRQVSSIHLSRDTRALLDELARSFQLHLVTSGSPETQQQKVALLKIAPYFKSLHYVDRDQGETKRDAFSKIISGADHPPNAMVCVGDRPDREILAANQLGVYSVRIRAGEFRELEPLSKDEEANRVILHVGLLRGLLAEYGRD